jgi:hypothetical protein
VFQVLEDEFGNQPFNCSELPDRRVGRERLWMRNIEVRDFQIACTCKDMMWGGSGQDSGFVDDAGPMQTL